MADVTERVVPRGDAAETNGAGSAAALAVDDQRGRSAPTPGVQVRAEDLQPYIGLKYLSRLFKLMAVILVLLLASEVITGLVTSGFGVLPSLVGEISRLVVLAGLLWGSGDLAVLFIDMGHDLRATRILVGRQLANRLEKDHFQIDPVVARPMSDIGRRA